LYDQVIIDIKNNNIVKHLHFKGVGSS